MTLEEPQAIAVRENNVTRFFFYWHYSPLWVLAFPVIPFHPALSLHCFLHRLISIIFISSSISAIHLFLGLLLILVPISFQSNILLGISLVIHPHQLT